MVKKMIFLALFAVFFISFASAEQQTLGNFQQHTCVNLVQTCANCTYVNITSVLYPNSTQAIGETVMSKSGTVYSYSFCNTTSLGQYIVNGKGDNDGETEVWVYDFEVTPTGKNLASGEGIVYLIMLIALTIVFVFSFYASIKISWKNERNNYDEIIQINWKKYLKMFAIVITYMTLIFITYFAQSLSYTFLNIRGVSLFFGFFFRLLMILILPVCISILIVGTVAYFTDKKFQNMLNRGIPVT